MKKKEDLELVAEEMRRILNSAKAHPRDKVAAGKLLSQLELPSDFGAETSWELDPRTLMGAGPLEGGASR